MSTVQARETFFHGGGAETAGTQRPADHPLVTQFPMFYESFDQFETEQPAPRRGRPPGSKTKPRAGADG